MGVSVPPPLPHPPAPLSFFFGFIPREREEGEGKRMGLSPVGADVGGASLSGFYCSSTARLVGLGGTHQPVPGCGDLLTLPSSFGGSHSSPWHHHEEGSCPQLGEQGVEGVRTSAPPSSLASI